MYVREHKTTRDENEIGAISKIRIDNDIVA